MLQHVEVRNLHKPVQKRVDEDVEWLCDSLGFSTGRDIEHVSPRTILFLLDALRTHPGVASETIANGMSMHPGRVNYHIRSLVDAGFLVRDHRLIFLRAGSVKAAVEEMRKDMNRIFDNLSDIAGEVDAELGFANRR